MVREFVKNAKSEDSTRKDRIALILCVTSFIVGVVLIFLGFFTEPRGDIYGSVIGSSGMFLSFAGAILGIGWHYSVEDAKFRSEMRARFYEHFPDARPKRDEYEPVEIEEDGEL